MRKLRTTALVTTAPLLLAAAGMVHPHGLNPSTADHWADLHVLLLPVFPLVTAGFLVPLWGRPGRDLAGIATVLAWISAFVYACFYTGLDAVAGIAAGNAVRSAVPGTDLGPLVGPLFHAGDQLGRVGAYAFGAAVAASSVALFLRYGARVLPGAVILLAASYSFVDSHIFWPRGVFTMLGMAVGFGLFAWAAGDRAGAHRGTLDAAA